jgi:hypothetical protein
MSAPSAPGRFDHGYRVMVTVIFLSKGGAALAMRPLARYSGPESGLLFGLSVNQAAATLAAVMVGHTLGFFGVDILNATIAMILAPAWPAPWHGPFRQAPRAGRGGGS